METKKKIQKKKTNKKKEKKDKKKGEVVREVNDGHEQPLFWPGLYLRSQQQENSVSNETRLPPPSSTAQNYTLHSSFTYQAVQTRNVKPRGSSRTGWRQNSRPSNEHKRIIHVLVAQGSFCTRRYIVSVRPQEAQQQDLAPAEQFGVWSRESS